MVLWGIERFLDEHLWLGEDGHLGSLLVQLAGVLLAVAGVGLLVTRLGPLQRWRRGEDDRPVSDEEDGRWQKEGGIGEESDLDPVSRPEAAAGWFGRTGRTGRSTRAPVTSGPRPGDGDRL
jgi:hypothetical protein